AAIGLSAIGKISARQRLFGEQINAHAGAVIKKIRLRVTEFDTADILSVSDAGSGKAAGTEQIALRHRDLGQPAVRGRIAALNRKITRRLLLDIDIDDDAVGR